MKNTILIEELQAHGRKALAQAKELELLPDSTLNWRVSDNSWSILECLAHLNLYGDFYLPEFSNRTRLAKRVSHSKDFKPGLLGNYFAKSMQPQAKLNKMKTFNDKNPLGQPLDSKTIQQFVDQTEELLKILDSSQQIDLNKVWIPTSISSFIKLKLGDAFRFYVYHIVRHSAQIKSIIDAQHNDTKLSRAHG